MFDGFLRERARTMGEPFHAFERSDYAAYVDCRLRQDGVRTFVAARGIALPDGAPDDTPSALTMHGLANRKNDPVLELIQAGVEVYLEAGRAGGFGWVVGVDRLGQAETLRRHGADVVVGDLADLLPVPR